MSKKNKAYFKRDKQAFSNLMKSQEVMSVLKSYGDRMAMACGEGYEADNCTVGGTRARCTVRPVTKEAYQDNLENNTLEKARAQNYG